MVDKVLCVEDLCLYIDTHLVHDHEKRNQTLQGCICEKQFQNYRSLHICCFPHPGKFIHIKGQLSANLNILLFFNHISYHLT